MKKKRETRKERREKLGKLQLGWELIRLIRHFFPDLIWQLKGVTDQRHQSYIRYENHVIKSLSANKQQWYNSHQRRWKKWRKRATSHGQYQMRSGRP